MRGIFITGTDTGAGKTWMTVAIMQAFKNSGLKVAGMKPVASGSEVINDGLVNDDARLIRAGATELNDYDLVNPYVFKEPIAPHIAAEKAGVKIDINKISAAYHQLASHNDIVIVEGVGGWRVPMSGDITTSDVVSALQLPVIMVVGMRLGCINHALLTAESILSDKIKLLGWVANFIEPDYLEPGKTIETLTEKISSPLLGAVPFISQFDANLLANHLHIDVL